MKFLILVIITILISVSLVGCDPHSATGGDTIYIGEKNDKEIIAVEVDNYGFKQATVKWIDDNGVEQTGTEELKSTTILPEGVEIVDKRSARLKQYRDEFDNGEISLEVLKRLVDDYLAAYPDGEEAVKKTQYDFISIDEYGEIYGHTSWTDEEGLYWTDTLLIGSIPENTDPKDIVDKRTDEMKQLKYLMDDGEISFSKFREEIAKLIEEEKKKELAKGKEGPLAKDEVGLYIEFIPSTTYCTDSFCGTLAYRFRHDDGTQVNVGFNALLDGETKIFPQSSLIRVGCGWQGRILTVDLESVQPPEGIKYVGGESPYVIGLADCQ